MSLSSARWLLPWIAVLFVSATLAHAMNTAFDRAGASARQPELQSALSTTGQGASAGAPQQSTSVSDTTMAPSERRIFGATSSTSPASTGHAYPDGCCTWDNWEDTPRAPGSRFVAHVVDRWYDGAVPGTGL